MTLSIIGSRSTIDFLPPGIIEHLVKQTNKNDLDYKSLPFAIKYIKNLIPLFNGAETQRTSKWKGEKKLNQTSSHLISSLLDHTLLSCQYQYLIVFPGKKEW